MKRNPLTFKQTDVERVIRAARKEGIDIGCVEITPTGSIVIYPVPEETEETEDTWADIK
jgi:hypothetical protein